MSKYSEIDPTKVTIKYIFTEENCDENDLASFVDYCKKYNLTKCSFQISLNFKFDKLKIEYLKKIIFLMSKFRDAKINKFFCDDHIAARFKKLNEKEKLNLINYIQNNNFENVCINNKKIENINIYGIGDIALNIIEKTNLISTFKNVNLYDSNVKKVGTKVNNLIIKKPEDLKENDFKIFISTAQSYDEIYQSLIKMNINQNRLISGLFV